MIYSNQKGFAAIGVVALIIVVVGIVGFVGYSVLTSESDDTASNSQADTTAPLTQEETEPESEAKAEKKTVKINKSVKNQLGFKVTVDEVVRNYPNEDVREGQEAILLKLTIATDGTYTGTPSESNMRLVVDGEETRTSYLINEGDLEADGYKVLGYDDKPQPGKPVSGYYAYVIPSGFKNVKFRLAQSAANIIGGGEVSAKNFDVKILPKE